MKFTCKIFFVMFIATFTTGSYAQNAGKNNALTGLLECQNERFPQEKVHIHFDRSSYTLGDTIWLEGYVVDAKRNIPSERSKVLYIDLINSENVICNRLQLVLNTGFAAGDLTLPDTLKEGLYQIRAYTYWMRNFDPGFFFKKNIPVTGSSQVAARVEKTVINAGETSAKYDIQFYPESGQLVDSLTSVIGFKAIDRNGNGVALGGKLVDESNNLILEFHSGYTGIGSFSFKPFSPKIYTAIVTLPEGTQQRIILPQIKRSGYILSATDNGTDSLFIKLQATADLIDKENMIFMPLSNGVPQFYMETRFPDKQINITVPKSKLPGGLLQLTLLSAQYEPVAERLVFNRYVREVKMSLRTLKPIYQKLEKVELALQALDVLGKPVTGSFSVAVVSSVQVDTNEDSATTIFSNLFLGADFYDIARPNYYFIHQSAAKDKELDQLLLTRKWRRFAWRDIVANKLPEISYPAEDKIRVSGKIISSAKVTIKNIAITLFAGELGKGIVLDTLTDDEGRFSFQLADSLKYLSIRLQVKAKGGPGYTIIPDSNLVPVIAAGRNSNITLRGYPEQNTTVAGEESGKDKIIRLNEVSIRSTGPKIANSSSANLNGPGGADQVILPETLEKIADLSSLSYLLHGVVPSGRGFKLRSVAGTQTPDVLILVDGVSGVEDVKEISPRDVESIEFLRSVPYTSIYGIRGVGGVLLITTKKGGVKKNGVISTTPNSLTFDLPFYQERRFYSPQYENAEASVESKDLRTTVYWNPDIITDKNGEARLSFYNNNIAGNYSIVIEGVSAKGELCRQVYNYSVE